VRQGLQDVGISDSQITICANHIFSRGFRIARVSEYFVYHSLFDVVESIVFRDVKVESIFLTVVTHDESWSTDSFFATHGENTILDNRRKTYDLFLFTMSPSGLRNGAVGPAKSLKCTIDFERRSKANSHILGGAEYV
jgi:hypothetical protein